MYFSSKNYDISLIIIITGIISMAQLEIESSSFDNLKALEGIFFKCCGEDYKDIWYGIWNKTFFKLKFAAYTLGKFIGIYPQLSFSRIKKTQVTTCSSLTCK